METIDQIRNLFGGVSLVIVDNEVVINEAKKIKIITNYLKSTDNKWSVCYAAQENGKAAKDYCKIYGCFRNCAGCVNANENGICTLEKKNAYPYEIMDAIEEALELPNAKVIIGGIFEVRKNVQE